MWMKREGNQSGKINQRAQPLSLRISCDVQTLESFFPLDLGIFGIRVLFLVQVQLKTKVLRTQSST